MKSNAIGSSLKVTGIIVIVVGAIAGLALATMGESFNAVSLIAYWAGSAIGGLVLIGFGEVVQLLQGIYNASRNITILDDEKNEDEIAEIDINKMSEKERSAYLRKFDVPENIK